MISNGTLWPDDTKEFVERTGIRHLQFTLDGTKRHHDVRRRYVSPDSAGRSSFETMTIDRLIGVVRIYLRINIDPGSASDVMGLVDFFCAKKWLRPGTKFYPYLAQIGPMTEHCSFLGKSGRMEDFRDEFDALNNRFQEAISRHIDPRGIQQLQYYPTCAFGKHA